MKNKQFETLSALALDCGAYKANIIDVKDISLDRAFREMCNSNACGMYDMCYMCPPDIGDIERLMNEVRIYDYALVYQTVTQLEDSYDFEGMISAKKSFSSLSRKIQKALDNTGIKNMLHLGAGGCGVCEVCAKRTNEPCRFPKLAIPSLEAYGVDVSSLAKTANMKYTNGQNTVTYFGAVLFIFDGEEK